MQEGLSADVKIEQERKIKSLEADIEKALARNAEKKNAEKYHMVCLHPALFCCHQAEADRFLTSFLSPFGPSCRF
jgi:hypothetical protein